MWFEMWHFENDYSSETDLSLMKLASPFHPSENTIFGQLARITTHQGIVHCYIILVPTIG